MLSLSSLNNIPSLCTVFFFPILLAILSDNTVVGNDTVVGVYVRLPPHQSLPNSTVTVTPHNSPRTATDTHEVLPTLITHTQRCSLLSPIYANTTHTTHIHSSHTHLCRRTWQCTSFICSCCTQRCPSSTASQNPTRQLPPPLLMLWPLEEPAHLQQQQRVRPSSLHYHHHHHDSVLFSLFI